MHKVCFLPKELDQKKLTSNSARSMANNPLSAISSLWLSCTTEVIVAIASLIFLKTPSLLPLADLESGCLRQVCYKKLTVINYKSSKETECTNMKKWSWAKCFFIQGHQKLELPCYNLTFTFEVVSSIMVDFSKIDLAAPISAFKMSSFKSW